MIKKIIFTFLALAMLISLCACNKKTTYEPIASSEEEMTTVFRIGKYDVPYELFRTFFLTNKKSLDENNASNWIGDTASEYRQKAIDEIMPQILDVYAMFSMCESYGIDINGEKVTSAVNEYVKLSVEGGMIGDVAVMGHESYDDYIAHLKTLYMNDSVSRLLIKYSVCEELLREKFFSEYKYDKSDVEEFYYSNECAHITWMNILFENTQYLKLSEMRTLAEKAHSKLAGAKNQKEVINIFVQHSAGASASEIENGFYIGKYTLDSAYMADIIDAAFSQKAGEYSDLIENDNGFYIIYKMEKDSTYLDVKANYEEIEELYLNNQLYRALEEYKSRLSESVSYSSFFNSLNFAEISY